jgi:citrate lyase subunit beta/citryl-CoA lyase
MIIRPRRSVLYMPGSNARALEKAKTLPADCLILDLEDAVAPDAKAAAREQVAAAVRGGGYGSRELVIRINGLSTPWGADDLKAAAGAGAHAILIPKVQTEHDLEKARQALWRTDAPSGLALWAMMETPLGVLNAKAIAADAAHSRHPLAAFVMGTNDLAKETRAALGGDRLPMIAWLSIAVAAGRAFGVDIVDGVFNVIGDEAGFRAECAQGRALGMDGKTLIHPSQIDPCNEAFSPSAEETAWARKVIEAFELPENQGKGVISVEGRMVELLHAEMARRTVAIANVIAAK